MRDSKAESQTQSDWLGLAWTNLARGFGEPFCVGRIKQAPEHFQVEEFLSFEPEGAGEHCLVQVEKTNHNTSWVASALAKFAGVSSRQIGFAGLKDRNATTTQWFSVPGHRLDWSGFHLPGVQVLQAVAHRSKLKPGALAYNRFRITIHLDDPASPDEVMARSRHVAQEGVPNYFGVQRFGRDASNLAKAATWFSGGRAPRSAIRGLVISAARSLLFNQILCQRVLQSNWAVPVCGDRMMLDGSRSHFHVEQLDQSLFDRAATHDIHPSGALWGTGVPETSAAIHDLEMAVANNFPLLRDGLSGLKLKQERRSLRVRPKNLRMTANDDKTCVLAFDLPPGAYATSVLREIIRTPSSDE